MQVFIIGTPLETFNALDNKRLRKQLLETQQILKTIVGASESWKNHPCVLQYRDHVIWLDNYCHCLFHYIKSGSECSEVLHYNEVCEKCKPDFHTIEFLDQMKRRLYTKNPIHYNQWNCLGTSDENWYYVDGELRKYKNGKRI